MAPLVTDPEIKKELAVFDAIETDEFYEDFVRVASFLSDKAAVILGLEGLEGRLREKAETQWQQSTDYVDRRQFYAYYGILDGRLDRLVLSHLTGRSKKGYFKHLVSSSLTDLEMARSFAVGGELLAPRAQYYLGPVSPDIFRQQILAGRPQGKDPFVDPGHGEYTHRIQWYAIMSLTSNIQLTHAAVDVYKAIGRFAAPEGSYQSTFQWGLWDAVCDRDNGTAAVVPFKAVSAIDFRCPNCLNAYLRSADAHVNMPYLNAFLCGRYEKRLKPADPLDYAARKVFGKPNYDALDGGEQKDLMSRLPTLRAVYDPGTGWR